MTANNRLRAPLMFAFREANRAGDARKKLDLRDDAGERIIAGRRAAPRVAITEATLRRELTRDLDMLMNAISFESDTDVTQMPFVRKSVLNFGFPDIARRTIDEVMVRQIRDQMVDALKRHEPRLVDDTIEIVHDDTIDKAELKIRFVIRADMNCDPLNVPLEFVADVDPMNAKFSITRR
jgi:type VI secretion system protein ImpF